MVQNWVTDSEKNSAILLSQFKKNLAENSSVEEIQKTLEAKAILPFPIAIKDIAEISPPPFMSSPPQEIALSLVPQSRRVVIALANPKSQEQTAYLLLHGLGHLLLGHVRPGDKYGHWDTLETAESGQRQWDRAVREAFVGGDHPPLPQRNSLEECTPKEKANLGLLNMMEDILGEKGFLHTQAQKYQRALYQRQAAQRLLNMLDQYSGGMLCDGVGLGKTYIATTLLVHYCNWWRDKFANNSEELVENPFRITLVVPNSIVSTWKREALAPLSAFGVPLSWIRVISHSKFSRILKNSEVLQHSEKNELSHIEHLLLSDLVIIDEAHNFRSTAAKRTLILRDMLRLQPRKEMRRRVLLLTATPINNSLEDLKQEVSLLFSTPLFLSDARTDEAYYRQAFCEIERRCDRARKIKSKKKEVSPLIVWGDIKERFSGALSFRDDLNLGNIFNLEKYLKEQDLLLQQLRERVRVGSEHSITPQKREPVRIASELLDKIVVQRSRELCKEIERQENSEVEVLFRPTSKEPEKLYFADEYDGTPKVLETYLPLFDTAQTMESPIPPLSFKIYMWHQVAEGIKSPNESSAAVGLQKTQALKRLESSPVSFLITLLRLTTRHAHRLRQLYQMCSNLDLKDKKKELQDEFHQLLNSLSNRPLEMVRWLVRGDEFRDPRRDFWEEISRAYDTTVLSMGEEERLIPIQGQLFEPDEEESEQSSQLEKLSLLWPLREVILQDMQTLLDVTPPLAQIVFGKFDRNSWPPNFISTNKRRNWPQTSAWARRIISDGKIRALLTRLLRALREGHRVIVFSQFVDTLSYIHSVMKACSGLSKKAKEDLLKNLDVSDVTSDELDDLINATAVVTGDTEDRDSLINSFAPYYRIGPFPPPQKGEKKEEGLFRDQSTPWHRAWKYACEHPIPVLFSTDVLAEGVNLQDASVLINFDIHWNPVRMIQRSGRIDRRLNPKIEKADRYPELEELCRKHNLSLPEYYWKGKSGVSPLTINMILPDELEEQLHLREKIALKTLAIDFTLGLEFGTGAEADWMQNYKYRGISALGDFSADRAIEKLSSVYYKLGKRVNAQKMKRSWILDEDVWLRDKRASEESPLIGSALIGREGEPLGKYTRYLKPKLIHSLPHWQWTVEFPGFALSHSFWICLDGKEFPAHIDRQSPSEAKASLPISPEILLKFYERLHSAEIEQMEENRAAFLTYQGITALSAGSIGDALEERAHVECEQVFLLQMEGVPFVVSHEARNERSKRKENSRL